MGLFCTLQMRNLLNHKQPRPDHRQHLSHRFLAKRRIQNRPGSSSKSGTNFSRIRYEIAGLKLPAALHVLKHCTGATGKFWRNRINRLRIRKREITRSRRSITVSLKQWPRGPINYPGTDWALPPQNQRKCLPLMNTEVWIRCSQ